ncbi:MAG: site-specific DNA-methyltransferase [Anaerolineae bacterium]
MPKNNTSKTIEALRHNEATRRNIPTAEYQAVLDQEMEAPLRIAYERRNRDLDPQLVWRGKDQQDWSDLVVHVPPLYIQEKVHPKVLIDDLLRATQAARPAAPQQLDLFADFNGIPDGADKTEFYQHDQNWTNRMILGDSLQVMASLAEREGLRGQVQCIYIDPPYGIKFNSNFQWSTTTREVKDGNAAHITREPEQVRAFRDTWRDGIHSYLTYLRDRLTVARDLLADSGSIFVQIGDENVHRVRALMDEVFGAENCLSQISYKTTQSAGAVTLDASCDYILWYCRNRDSVRFNNPLKVLQRGEKGATRYNFAENTNTGEVIRVSPEEDENSLGPEWRFFTDQGLTSRGDGSENTMRGIVFEGRTYLPPAGHWRTTAALIEKRLIPAGRVIRAGTTIRFKKCFGDFGCLSLTNLWDDVGGGIQSRNDPKIYVVQTSTTIVQRCVLMATNPGDLVLDPTCGSGTTAYVAEQWGRRWITIDTSRVALALARARLMGARYPYYLLADSREGQLKEAEVTRGVPSSQPTYGSLKQGFVYERVPHITLKSIANNAEIDVTWEKWQTTLEPLRQKLNAALNKRWEEWEIPREADAAWPQAAKTLHGEWWQARIARQKEIDASIAAKAEFEYLYDRPYTDPKRVRVAGPFTVESLSPHRVLGVDENDELIDGVADGDAEYEARRSFPQMILENLRAAGVQQAHKEDRITFTSLTAWPGELVCAEGRYVEGDKAGAERRAGIFIGPEFGTVTRPDLVDAAREAADAGFDVLIACAFNYEAHATEFNKLGRIPVLKARMNADLHMADDLKTTGKGNLFVIFGEPDVSLLKAPGGQIQVKINGVDVFHPQSGEVRSDGPEGIACWFIDTDYNEESFFVRHAYFLGANDPYGALKTTLRAEIDEDAWKTLNSATSRPFERPASGRIAVKVINHLGDEVMKVFRV